MEDAKIPYEREINICDTLLNYLTSLLNRESGGVVVVVGGGGGGGGVSKILNNNGEEEEEIVNDNENNCDQSKPTSSGLVAMKRDIEDYFEMNSKNKKNKQKVGNSSTAIQKKKILSLLVHPLDIQESFTLMDIKSPVLYSDVPASIESVEAKKVFYQSQERGSVPSLADKAAAAAATAPSDLNRKNEKDNNSSDKDKASKELKNSSDENKSIDKKSSSKSSKTKDGKKSNKSAEGINSNSKKQNGNFIIENDFPALTI